MSVAKHHKPNNQQHLLHTIFSSPQWNQRLICASSHQKSSPRNQPSYPPPRANHISALYKNKIFIWGGNIFDPDPSGGLLFLYAFELDTHKWKRLFTKSSHKDMEPLEGQSHAISGNRWYMLGGANQHSTYASQLWRLNLDSLQWIKLEQKGETPNVTEGGQLVAFQKNWLLHYEGFNSRALHHSHHIHVYSVDSKTWFRCEGIYKHCLKFRIGTAMCLQNGRIFLFGGASQSGEDLQYLSDMYELRLNVHNKLSQSLDLRVISKATAVPPRAEHSLIPLAKNYLCLIGGCNNQQQFQDVWVYHLKNQLWTSLGNSQYISQRIGYSCAFGHHEIFLFGGFKQKDDRLQPTNDLWSFQFQCGKDCIQSDNEGNDASFDYACSLCYEKRNNFLFHSKPFSSQYIKDLRQNIQFPYAAFGLLLDNSLLTGATEITLNVDIDPNGLYFIKVEDNGQCPWEEQDFLPNMAAFCSQNQMILQGCDKKVKRAIIKDNQIKQYGVNLKLASLRLGKRLLFISFSADILRVFLLYEENASEECQDRQYLMRYFAWNQTKKELLNPDMTGSYQYIQIQYRKYVNDVLTSKINKNVVYIFDTILDDEEEEMRCRRDINDIYHGAAQDIAKLEARGFLLGQCIDISLKAYLCSLYLKNQNLTISFGFSDAAVNLPINLQITLQQIDKLSKSGNAVQLDGLVQFDFKFAQFYFLRDLRPAHKFFNNGVLLYYKNRLICRQKPNLGQMLPFLIAEETFNCLPFFGFAELPQNVPHNASKTAFTFTVMLQKMQSRLKFVEESFKDRSKKFQAITQLPHPKPKHIEDNEQSGLFKVRKSILGSADARKRVGERFVQDPKKKSRKQIQKSEFTPPSYKMKQIDQEIRRTRLQEENRVLLQQEDSSVQEIRQIMNYKPDK